MTDNKNLAIKLTEVGKKYTVHHEKPTLSERILNGKNETFWALKNVNLTISKGEMVALIGSNGSGKTTLLKIVSGITSPTHGQVFTNGKIVSLIDLTAGFHPDLTGIQNIFLNGMLIGMSRTEIQTKLNKIIKFAGIGTFIDAPLFTYSSGMILRLGFSISIFAEPDILILDENIAVGDEKFKKMSVKKVKAFSKKKKTIIIASHDLEFVKNNFDTVYWLDKGQIVKKGNFKVVSDYEKQQI